MLKKEGVGLTSKGEEPIGDDESYLTADQQCKENRSPWRNFLRRSTANKGDDPEETGGEWLKVGEGVSES